MTERLGTYEAVLFDMGSPEHPYPIITRGIPLVRDSITDHLLIPMSYTRYEQTVAVTHKDHLDITDWFGIKDRAYSVHQNKLLSATLPLCTPQGSVGVILLIRSLTPSGVRVHKEYSRRLEATRDEYRALVCYIELAYPSEAAREEQKKMLLPKHVFDFPGPNGRGLIHYGIRVIFPIFEDDRYRLRVKPHEHLILMEAGTSIEVISQYREDLPLPNWYELHVNNQREVTTNNIRDPFGRWMHEAKRRIEQEKQGI